MFPIKYATTNTENGELYAIAISVFVAVAFVGFAGYVIYTLKDTESVGYLAGVGGAAVAIAVIGYFVLHWILLAMFMPGDVIQVVDPVANQIVTV